MEDEMGEEFGTHGRDKRCIQGFGNKAEGKMINWKTKKQMKG
jgi:hypothetical protein